MKPFIILVALLACISCSHEQKKQPVKTPLYCHDLDDIRNKGELIALTDKSSSSYFVYKGTPLGFEYDLLKEFAKHLGVKLVMLAVDNLDCIIDQLEEGEGDIIAANFTVTDDRNYWLSFSTPILHTRQVLVQRIDGENTPIRNIQDLSGKTITVRERSSFFTHIKALSDSIDAPISIETVENKTTEALIREVSEGQIDFTVADENVARLNKTYYPHIDIKTSLSDTQYISWATRKNAPILLDSMNEWLSQFVKTKRYAMIYLKYFKARTQHKARVMHSLSSLKHEGQISAYDDIFKEESQRLGWDWKLLAALVRKESNFNPNIQSHHGACGLMQLMPATASHFGADSIFDPVQNIKAGVSFLIAVRDLLSDEISDSTELIKFTLAAYNVGLGHVKDARRLADKYEQPNDKWEHVATYLKLKSEPEFYNDSVVKHGYCRGYEPVNHVEKILEYWEHYRNGFD